MKYTMSYGEFIYESNVVNESRVSAMKVLQDLANGETSRAEGLKMSKELAQHYVDWLRTSPYGRKYGKDITLNLAIPASFSWGIERGIDNKLKNELEELKKKFSK